MSPVNGALTPIRIASSVSVGASVNLKVKSSSAYSPIHLGVKAAEAKSVEAEAKLTERQMYLLEEYLEFVKVNSGGSHD